MSEPRPSPCPNLGHGGKEYFRWSAANDIDDEFLRLYGARVPTMARRYADDPDCKEAIDRLFTLTGGSVGSSAVPGTIEHDRQQIDAYVRQRVTEFVDQPPGEAPKNKEDAIQALTDLVTSIALSPAFRDLIA